jgi:hypothetical protein
MKINQIVRTLTFALLAASLAACNLNFKSGATSGGSAAITFTTPGASTIEPAPTNTPVQSIPPQLSSGNIVTAIVNASKAQLAAKAWQASSNIVSNQVTVKGTLEYFAPNRYHLTTSTIDAIAIGSKSYMNQNGKWIETPLDVAGFISSLMNSALPQLVENNITNAKLIGSDTLNGKTMTVYQFDNTFTQDNINITTNTKLWVGTADGLPYQELIQGDINGVQTTTTNLMAYDPSVQIEDPSAK